MIRTLPWLGLLAVAACAGSDASKAGARSPLGTERETELRHEPCDASSSSAKKTDVNGDGRPDITHVMSGQHEVCRILDLNLDGAIDEFIYYDDANRERRREADFDRDGRPDEITYLQAGTVIRKERETNFDNKIDTWDYYEGGRLVRRERDTDGDRFVDQWWDFNNPQNAKCALVTSDRNADGKPDTGSLVDLCAETSGTPKSSEAASSEATPSAAAGPAASPPGGGGSPAAGKAAPPAPAPTGSPSAQPSAASPSPSPQQPANK